MVDNWIETTEAEDVAGSLRHVLRAAQFLGEDTQAWKWVVMALHSALQGACVCHLTTTAKPLGAVTKKNAREWSAYYDERRSNPNASPPKTNLMALPDLLKAVRKPSSAGSGCNVASVAISELELNLLINFHSEFRNQFAHFEPMTWSIEVSGITQIVTLIARIIGDILRAGWAFRHQDDAQRDDMKRNLLILPKIGWHIDNVHCASFAD